MSVPKFDELFNPLIRAMHELGGSASVAELEGKVGEILKLSDEELNEIHDGTRTRLSYNLAWARTYLKNVGYLEKSGRGVWSFTDAGFKVDSEINPEYIKKAVRKKTKQPKTVNAAPDPISSSEDFWQDQLLQRIKALSPSEFERLCQRVLRESGFVSVEVTGKSGDGGIDGRGIVRLGGFISFGVIFQCKRYSGSVSSQEIREFKGTMVGRAEKGLFITTGTFTRDAMREAQRDGSPPIDLIDGIMLAEKMKDLGLGVAVTTQELVHIDEDLFNELTSSLAR